MDFKKKVGALGAASSVLFAAGIAGAAWTSNGSGSGSATAGTNAPLVIAGATSDTLYPTLTVDFTVNVDNPNPYDVTVTGFAQDGTITSSDTDCNAASVTFTPGSVSQEITADTAEDVVAGTLTMSNAANDDCKLATFTVPLTVAGASS